MLLSVCIGVIGYEGLHIKEYKNLPALNYDEFWYLILYILLLRGQRGHEQTVSEQSKGDHRKSTGGGKFVMHSLLFMLGVVRHYDPGH